MDLFADFDTLTMPRVDPPVSLPKLNTTVQDIADSIGGVFQTYYGTKAQIAQAKANAAIAKYQGQSAVFTARAGLPSPGVMILGGLGVLALVLVTRK